MRLSDDAAIQFSSYFDQNRKLIEDSYNKKTDTLIISKENIIRGNNLLKYYNKHKLILAGYSIDVDEPILNVFTELINEFNPLDNSVKQKKRYFGFIKSIKAFTTQCNKSESTK